MEEDIKILEEIVEIYYDCAGNEEDYDMRVDMGFMKRETQALQNLIKGYRKLEEELKREKIWRIRLEKENEDTCNEVNNNYIRKSLVIPKSKIKEKIEEKCKAFRHRTRIEEILECEFRRFEKELMEDK
jgi:hypothetical protein